MDNDPLVDIKTELKKIMADLENLDKVLNPRKVINLDDSVELIELNDASFQN